jgi:HEPN domain-containing protein
MSQTHDGTNNMPDEGQEDDLEHALLHGVTLQDNETHATAMQSAHDEDEEDEEVPLHSDVQGALGLYAEAVQDMATSTVELSLGRHFACADYCNQAVEKAAQAISLLRFGRRSAYNHDLQALGKAVGAPEAIQLEMAILTPFHPEAFYADTPPEEADAIINAEQASSYMQSARKVLRWARDLVLRA